MRAVVIGGNGFIGSHVVDALLSDGWQVVAYDRSPSRYRPPLQPVEYVIDDLANVDRLSSLLLRTDVVFHLVSTTIPQTSNDAPVYDIESNLVSTVRFLEVCVKTGVGKVVFISSGGTVYGIPNVLPVKEGHPVNPICSYGIVKLAIEKYLHLFHHLYGLSYTVLRPSNPYGIRQNPDGSQGAIAVFLGRAAQGLPITLWGDGEITRDYFHVTDLAQACLRAATTETATPVFNIGRGQGISLNQLLTIIKSVGERPLDIIRRPCRPFDVPKLVLNVQAAKRELNWEATIPLEEGIADTWRWVRSLDWSKSKP